MSLCITLLLYFLNAETKLPDFAKRPENANVPIGADAKFEARITGEPRPNVKW
jgi:hypothetical protein